MWLKIIVAVIPAAIIGVLFDDKIDELFYHPVPVAIALIVVGVLFIVVETIMKGKKPSIRNIGQITYKAAVIIGLFQVLAAVFSGKHLVQVQQSLVHYLSVFPGQQQQNLLFSLLYL